MMTPARVLKLRLADLDALTDAEMVATAEVVEKEGLDDQMDPAVNLAILRRARMADERRRSRDRERERMFTRHEVARQSFFQSLAQGPARKTESGDEPKSGDVDGSGDDTGGNKVKEDDKANSGDEFNIGDNSGSGDKTNNGDDDDKDGGDEAKSGDVHGQRRLTNMQLGAMLPLPWSDAYTRITTGESRAVQRLLVSETISLVLKDLIIDSRKVRAAREEMQKEIAAYDALEALQGDVLPFLVYGDHIAGRFLIVTTDAGDSLHQLKPPFSEDVCAGAVAALDALHDAGYLHGDVALRNIVLEPSTGCVRLVDLGRARPETDKRVLDEEKRAMRALFTH